MRSLHIWRGEIACGRYDRISIEYSSSTGQIRTGAAHCRCNQSRCNQSNWPRIRRIRFRFIRIAELEQSVSNKQRPTGTPHLRI